MTTSGAPPSSRGGCFLAPSPKRSLPDSEGSLNTLSLEGLRMFRKPDRQSIAWALAALSINILFLPLPPTASASPAGSSFDHIIIIAMENQNYPDVLGDGTRQPDVQQGPRPSSAAYSSSARASQLSQLWRYLLDKRLLGGMLRRP